MAYGTAFDGARRHRGAGRGDGVPSPRCRVDDVRDSRRIAPDTIFARDRRTSTPSPGYAIDARITARRRDAIAATPSPTARRCAEGSKKEGKDAEKTHDTNARRARACRLEPAGPCA